MKESAREQLEQSGHMNTDPAKIQGMLDDMQQKSKALDPQTKAAVEGMAAVMDQLMVPVKEARPIGVEILTNEFQDASSIRAVSEINGRLEKLQTFRTASQKLLSMYPNLDLMLKTELTRRNLPALQVKECTDNFIKSAHLEIAVPLAQSNVDFGDLMIRKFALLKQQFGHWYVKSNVIYFEDTRALQQWNGDLRQLFKVSEERERLERSLVEANKAN